MARLPRLIGRAFVDGDLAGQDGRAAAEAFFEDLVEIAAGRKTRSLSCGWKPRKPRFHSRSRGSLRSK